MSHYFSADPQTASKPSEVTLSLPDLSLKLHADKGVFSASRVDPGTIALLRSAELPPTTGDFLDLGCGYGPIACTLATRSPQSTVWAVDVNSRALSLTKANAKALGLGNVRAVEASEIPSDLRFAGIWSNPPIRIGKEALHILLKTWLSRLSPEAHAWLVVQRHLGADSLVSWLDKQGWPTQRVASKSGYRVLRIDPGSQLGQDIPRDPKNTGER